MTENGAVDDGAHMLARYSTDAGGNGLRYEARNAQPATPPFLLVGMRHGTSAQDFNETVWMVREAVQTRVSEAATTALAHPMACGKVQERSITHHVRGV